MTDNERTDAAVQAEADEIDTQAEGDETDAGGIGYRRLESELTSFRAEFESLVETVATRTDAVEDGSHWYRRGRALLDRAADALAAGRIEQGWYYLHDAKRMWTYGLEALDDPAILQGEAREVLVEATNADLGWRTDAIRERLTENGTLREHLTWPDLRSALELLHDGYQRIHLKRQHLQAQFRYLSAFAAVAIVVLLAVAMASTAVGILPSPFVDFSAGAQPATPATGSGAVAPNATGNASESPSNAAPGSPAEPVGFLVYVVLAGVLGASLFGLRSLQKQPVSGTTPQHLTARLAAVTRIVVGAGSALAVFFFLRSGLLPAAVATGADSGPFLISLAFVAGYSERLVHSTVESVASKGDETAKEEA